MSEAQLRQHVVYLLNGGGAHLSFEAAIDDFPAELRGITAPGLPHTAWQLLEHMRICQWDILEFSRNREHVSPDWPEKVWPPTATPPTPTAWDDSIAAHQSDRQTMIELIEDPRTDLFAPIPWGSGQTILREGLLVADHTAYHLGQMVYLRRALGCWEE